jgi:ATP-GRASP peptide maturase of grasp-with-spasm system
MILIFSEIKDQSTCNVIDWLYYYKENFIVITERDIFEVIELTSAGKFKLKIDNQIIDSNDIKSVWYRRGGLNLQRNVLPVIDEYESIGKLFQYFYNYEMFGIENFLCYSLLNCHNINNQLYSRVNKLMVLKNAETFGLLIPPSIVTSKKEVLLKFIEQHKNVITKPAVEGFFGRSDDYLFNVYTEIVTDEMLSQYDKNFCPSFFQKLIPKKYEIRTFYLKGKFFSMAIFSQSNFKTITDFRHYDEETPNRCVPFKMPYHIEKKIDLLMKFSKINSASIDLIYSIDKKFYFLEINPIGQFGMTSAPCNYHLEKHIANELSKYKN